MMSLMPRRCFVSSSAAKCAKSLYTLDFALSGNAALDILDGHIGEQIILLVSDINMPGMTALELVPVVKQRRPDLPVFMISAYGDQDTMPPPWRAAPTSS